MESPRFESERDAHMRHVEEVREVVRSIRERHGNGEGDPEGMGTREVNWLNEAMKNLLIDGETVLGLSEQEFLEMQRIIREIVGDAPGRPYVPETDIEKLAELIDQYEAKMAEHRPEEMH